MRQNGATSAPLFYCVSYEILCETRIKPSFFGNCLIFLSQVVRHWARAENEKVVKYFKKLGNMRVLFYTRVVKYSARKGSTLPGVVKFKPRIKPGFLNLPPGSRVQENRGKSEGNQRDSRPLGQVLKAA